MTCVKICGLTRQQDVELALELGANFLGFVQEPSSPRFIPTLGQLRKLLRLTKGLPVATVVVYAVLPRNAKRQQAGAEQALSFLRPAHGARIQAVRLQPGMSVEDVVQVAARSDILLLDAYSEFSFGGTGEKADWGLAADIVAASPIPVMLAGGLTPQNVGEAIRKVRPFAVDVSSGVEASPGVKDPEKMRAFVGEALGVGR